MYYEVLQVTRKATADDIRAAYRRLALSTHPDKHSGSADTAAAAARERFLEVQRAYEVLRDDARRREYDATLARARAKLRGFVRPQPLPRTYRPVAYKLADDHMYVFESATHVLRCGLDFGDIEFARVGGCFVGLAGDEWLYWCRSGHDYATRLCQRGSSFALSSIVVLRKAHLDEASVHVPGATGAAGCAGGAGTRRSSTFARVSRRNSTTTTQSSRDAAGDNNNSSGSSSHGIFAQYRQARHTAYGDGGDDADEAVVADMISPAERIKRELRRREWLRMLRERVSRLPDDEAVARAAVQHDMQTSWSALCTEEAVAAAAAAVAAHVATDEVTTCHAHDEPSCADTLDMRHASKDDDDVAAAASSQRQRSIVNSNDSVNDEDDNDDAAAVRDTASHATRSLQCASEVRSSSSNDDDDDKDTDSEHSRTSNKDDDDDDDDSVVFDVHENVSPRMSRDAHELPSAHSSVCEVTTTAATAALTSTTPPSPTTQLGSVGLTDTSAERQERQPQTLQQLQQSSPSSLPHTGDVPLPPSSCVAPDTAAMSRSSSSNDDDGDDDDENDDVVALCAAHETRVCDNSVAVAATETTTSPLQPPRTTMATTATMTQQPQRPPLWRVDEDVANVSFDDVSLSTASDVTADDDGDSDNHCTTAAHAATCAAKTTTAAAAAAGATRMRRDDRSKRWTRADAPSSRRAAAARACATTTTMTATAAPRHRACTTATSAAAASTSTAPLAHDEAVPSRKPAVPRVRGVRATRSAAAADAAVSLTPVPRDARVALAERVAYEHRSADELFREEEAFMRAFARQQRQRRTVLH